MRQGLEAIARGIGERADCAVLGIVHFGKRDSGDTGKLILGSIAWSQVARSVLALAKDDDGGDLVMSATKSNLAPGDAASLSARLVDRGVRTPDGIPHVGRVEWIGETDRNARDLLAGPDTDEGRTERRRCHPHVHEAPTARLLSTPLPSGASPACPSTSPHERRCAAPQRTDHHPEGDPNDRRRLAPGSPPGSTHGIPGETPVPDEDVDPDDCHTQIRGQLLS
jgi:hypothetical protein